MNTVEEVRSILSGGKPVTAPVVEHAPLDEAVELIRTHRDLTATIQRKLDGLSAAMGEAHERATRDPSAALAALAGKPRDALAALKDLIDASLTHVESVTGRAVKPVSEARVHLVDRALFELTEGVDTNAAKSGVRASMTEVEGFLNSVKRLKTGSSVGIGRNTYRVSKSPALRGKDMLVTLSGPGMGAADGYTLLVPGSPAARNEEYEVLLVHDESDARVGLFMSDVVLEAVDKGQYKDFSRVNPGDTIRITKQTFRVIGKSDSAAIIQPEKIAKEVYGGFSAAPAPVKSPGDFAGRGGKDFGDAVLAGATVLKFNPHNGQYSFPNGKLPGEYEMADTIQIVGHEPDEERFYEGVMGVERFDLMVSEAYGNSSLEKLSEVAKRGESMKVNGVYVDPATARVVLAIHEALGEPNQERLAGLPVQDMIAVAMKMVSEAAGGKRFSGWATNIKSGKKLPIHTVMAKDENDAMEKAKAVIAKAGGDPAGFKFDMKKDRSQS